MKPNILVFDVESTNLHGSGFAVGAIVVNRGGTEVDRFELLSKEGEALAPNGYGFKQLGLQAQKFNRSDKKNKEKFLGRVFNSFNH